MNNSKRRHDNLSYLLVIFIVFSFSQAHTIRKVLKLLGYKYLMRERKGKTANQDPPCFRCPVDHFIRSHYLKKSKKAMVIAIKVALVWHFCLNWKYSHVLLRSDQDAQSKLHCSSSACILQCMGGPLQST